MVSDLFNIFQWWAVFFFIGIIFLPITNLIFSNFSDKGYIFSKIIGIALISYAVFILGFLKILPFTELTIFLVILCYLIINTFLINRLRDSGQARMTSFNWKIMLFEEILFILILIFWSLIHGHQPEIHGLEKYMDYGFMNSILRAKYFPPLDMWLTPFYINYYYFGHLATAVLTKLSHLPSSITFNLMLSTISALSFVSAFSIGANLLSKLNAKRYTLYAGGLLTAFILNFAGNLHTIYLFFKPYQNDNPVPFWQLVFSPLTFPNSYWYPNATRFIENTIHEFPLYSSVVSDLHGHVLDIPFVLLTIAVLFSFMQHVILRAKPEGSRFFAFQAQNDIWFILLLAFLLAIMYMTNAWDGIIYFLLTILVFSYLAINTTNTTNVKYYKYFNIGLLVVCILIGSILFSLPFNLNFKPFASGIGVLCAPTFLTDIGKIGPFIFEKDHCQHSPFWQLLILYGFFYFWVASFIVFRFVILSRVKISEGSSKILRFAQNDIAKSDIFVGILILLSTLLIIVPEFIYIKDIYPAHYRANTMFKLVYQSFMMLSLSSGYIAVRIISNFKSRLQFIYLFIGSICLLVVFLYPYFAINSYFGNLKIYSGLDGTKYLKPLYPTDYDAIVWINKNIKGQPVILEAQGDSYTDYARISSNTGLPTVLGWTVHEWLWRGTYDIPSPRIDEVSKMYESQDLEETKNLLKKYAVVYIFIGDLERQKYPEINEEKFKLLGKIIYQKGNTKIFKVNIK